MQIFRPYQSHTQTAKFLDYKRLNKQVVEAYQISMTCLALLGITDNKASWQHHPIVKFIYNNSKPYLPDLYNYITALNQEWMGRGYNRSQEFQDKLDKLGEVINRNKNIFDWNSMPPFFCGFGRTEMGSEVWDLYKELLRFKWAS